MRIAIAIRAVLFGSLLAASIPAVSQAAPVVRQKITPIEVGYGFSNFDPSFGGNRQSGTVGWFGWSPNMFRGFGLAAELRDIRWGSNTFREHDLKEDTAMGGLTYTWRHFENVTPHGKFLMGGGHVDFKLPPNYNFDLHTTKKAISFGGGLDYHLWEHMWARVDYDYQFWGNMLGYRPEPNGVTIGINYNFRPYRSRAY